MKFKAVVFDLDGTLLDSLEDLGNSANAALSRLECPPHPIADYKIFVGDGLDVLARRVLPEAQRNNARVAELVSLMRDEYGRRWADRTRPYAGVPELLDALVGRGVRLAVLTNKPHDFATLVVERLLSQWRFDVVLGAREHVAKKPDPAGAHEIAETLKMRPVEFAFMGDTNVDMRTARAAGMFATGALWGFRPRSELEESGAQALLAHPSEFLALLGE